MIVLDVLGKTVGLCPQGPVTAPLHRLPLVKFLANVTFSLLGLLEPAEPGDLGDWQCVLI